MKSLSIATRNMIVTSINIVVVGLVIIIASYLIQGQVLSEQMQKESTRLIAAWAGEMTSEHVSAAQQNPDVNSDIQKEMIKYVNDVSLYNPNVSQAYVFGTELQDGNKTSLIIQPTHILEFMSSVELKLGDMLDQPPNIVKGIEKMLKTKEVVLTDSYSDDVGTWVTAISPVLGANGEIFAYFGMDIDASMIKYGQNKLLSSAIICLLIILLICLSFQYFINRRTFKPLDSLVKAIDQVGRGNYNLTLKEGNDELGKVNAKFNIMAGQIRGLLSTIGEVSDKIMSSSEKLYLTADDNKSTSEKIAQNISSISDNIGAQGIATSESVTSLNSIATGINSVAENTADVAETSATVQEESQNGNYAIQQIVKQMQEIDTSVLNSAKVMTELQEHSEEIGNIVKVIGEIAGQTNLLSLNASIEAARAGEQGKGFSVVANEVKKLAEQSKTFASQIENIVSSLQSKTDDAVHLISIGTKNVGEGLKLANNAGNVFNNIMKATNSVADQIQEVSAATEEIAAETEQISATVKQLSEVAKQNSTSTRNLTVSTDSQQESLLGVVESANELKEISQRLQQVLSSLQYK